MQNQSNVLAAKCHKNGSLNCICVTLRVDDDIISSIVTSSAQSTVLLGHGSSLFSVVFTLLVNKCGCSSTWNHLR